MLPDPDLSRDGTPLFRELRGEYVDGAGQVVNLREYLDFFEPLGTALTRLPDGTGGPFLYQFSGGGGRVIGALGWVVNASAKRYGAWKLWGLWADRPIPPLTLSLLWPELSDARNLPDLIERANGYADRLLRRTDVLDEIQTRPLHDEPFRALLKAHITRAWRTRDRRERPIEVEVGDSTLDLLPWLHLLGPVDPELAQLQPNRFNGVGYQYILTTGAPAVPDDKIPKEVDAMVDAAAGDVLEAWERSVALRERGSRPRPRAVERRPQPETSEMRTSPSPSSSRKPAPKLEIAHMWRVLRDVIIIGLLAWIGLNLHLIRKSATAAAPAAEVTTTTAEETTTSEPPPTPTPTRAQRIARALSANPPRNIQIAPAVLNNPSEEVLARAAIEIFLRRNACHARTEVVDGRFSTAEQRSIRNCAILTRERLMTTDLQPHSERALAWLEKLAQAR